MNASRAVRLTACLLAGGAMLPGLPTAARAAEGNGDITAVSSTASKDYIRAKRPDGRFEAETYAFGQGGHYGANLRDDAIDQQRFLDIARAIATPLASRNYIASKDPNKTKFLIMVYWGATDVPPPQATSDGLQSYQKAIQDYQALLKEGDPNMARAVLNAGMAQLSLENEQRDKLDFENAAMLGYDSEGLVGTDYGRGIEHTALRGHRDDLVAEIEENRYFVVLMAFDFQMLWKQKKHKLVWETRFSIQQRGHDFGRVLPAMAQYASQYFGEDSHGLIRRPVPEGEVEVGAPRSLGQVPEK